MKNLVVLFLTFLASFSQAEVVKLFAKNCATQKAVIQGSGILFRMNGQLFVVSSEHATPASKELCFSYGFNGSTTYPIRLITSDWENGLSLLKLESEQKEISMTFENFATQAILGEQNVIASGYPSASLRLLSDSARVIMTESARSPFANRSALMEVTGAQVEFGMSGGALISKESGQVIGLLSHQRLVMAPGEASRASESQQNTSNHILVIPSATIKAWVQNVMNGVKANYNRLNSNSILGSGVIFKQLVADVAPIQLGGDGVGVTGENSDAAGVTIEVSLSNMAALNQSQDSNPETAWLKQVSPALLKQNLKINRLIIFDQANARIQVSPIKNLADFVSQIRNHQALPLIENTRSMSSSDLVSLKAEIFETTEDSELIDLQTTLQALIDAKIQYSELKITPTRLSQFEKHSGWKKYFSENFEKAVQAKAFLEKLR